MTVSEITDAVCERCGARATIHITNLESGLPTIRHLCGLCADASSLDDDQLRANRRSAIASVLIPVGLFILALSLLADALRPGSPDEFGWQQWMGLIAAIIILFLGAMTRNLTLLIVGMITAAIGLLADWLEFGRSRGLGWQQQCGALVGLFLILFGLVSIGRPRRAFRGPKNREP